MDTSCFKCQTQISLEATTISRREECPHCHADLRCCKMCTHFDPRAYNECRETQASRVQEKDKANFCDYFKLSDKPHSEVSEKEKALAQLKALFKN